MMSPHDANQPDGAPRPPEKARHRPSTSPPAILSQSPTPFNLLRCLRRRLVVGLFVGIVLGSLAGAGAWFFAPPPKHLVRTYLQVPNGSSYSYVNNQVMINHTLGAHQTNAIAMCKSRLVLNAALHDPKVIELPLLANKIDTVAWLEKEVQVDFSFAPEIMRIAMNGMETDDLVVLVNAIREAYKREVVEGGFSVRKQYEEWLSGVIQKYEDLLKAGRDTQKNAVELGNPRDAKARDLVLSFIQMQLGMNQKELLGTQSDLGKVRRTLDELKAQDKPLDQLTVPESAIAEALAKDESVVAMKAEIHKLEVKIAGVVDRAVRGEQEESVIAGRREMARLESKIRESGGSLRPKIIEKLRERYRIELQTNLTFQKARLANLERTEKELVDEKDRLEKRIVELDKQGFKLDMFQDDISYLEKMTKRLRDEREALKLALAQPSRVALIEEGTVIRVDVMMRKIMMTGGASLGGLCFALFGIAWLEFRSRRIDQIDEVVHGLGMKLVGTVPRIGPSVRATFGKTNGDAEAAQQLLTDSVDAARTLLLHLARTQVLRTVMVSSARAGKGRLRSAADWLSAWPAPDCGRC